MINPTETVETYKDIESNGFQFTFKNVITRNASKSCLDHVMVNDPTLEYTVNILPYDLFDHKIIVTEVRNEKWLQSQSKRNRSPTTSQKRIDYKKFSEIIKKDKIFFNSNKSLDENYEIFTKKIRKAKDDASEVSKSKKKQVERIETVVR